MSTDLKVNIPSFTLNNGLKIPAVGYGTWVNVDKNNRLLLEDKPKLLEAMSHAIDVGYRHLDTAHLYRTEPEVGWVVRKKIQEGVITREQMFITTKVWQHNHRPEDVEASVRGSLQRMGLDYVDLVLMHWPMAISVEGADEKIDYIETWRGFESVLDKGLAKSIGVSNFNAQQIERLLRNCRVKPVVNQVELNINLAQKDLVSYCQKNGIQCVAYTPFGSMMPSREDPNNEGTKVDDPRLTSIAKKHGKTVGQIALRHLYERGLVAIPKTITKSRVVENASIFDFQLDASDVETLNALDNGYRTVRPLFWQEYEYYPFDRVDAPIPKIPEQYLKWEDGGKIDI
ncbi:putative aldo-ketose reductase 1 [Danaus plexippus plexippus]|uniref:Aldo-ketose reductase 1 n=1 Tax=Danaus plexippus plexippus TaxID=278856 RepID=A0A212ENH0_DANPL|nr:putative aldo-ketose reductase 1 [Danaus plexippus plexippus]